MRPGFDQDRAGEISLKELERCMATIAAIALTAFAAGCIAWTTGPKGNLQSVGLPGVPVWTAKEPSPEAPLASNESAEDELTRADTGSLPWLDELNYWRQAAGLKAVADNLQLSDGSAEHAHYLLENARTSGNSSIIAAGMGMGAAQHSESPGSVAYSDKGAEAAFGGRHVYGVVQTADIAWGQNNQKADVDSLLVVPFHRLSLLAPWAEVAGYGESGKSPDRVAAMALRGRQGRDANLVVRFPPEGSKMPFAIMPGSEWPNPLTACPGYTLPVGLPITLQLATPANLGPYSISDQTQGRELTACAFDAQTYENPDATQEADARRALAGAKAIVVIPKYPLKPGHRYKVAIQAGGEYEWSFEVTGTADNPAVQNTAAQ
jgi:hypothetical protein